MLTFGDMDEAKSLGGFKFDLSEACQEIAEKSALSPSHPLLKKKKLFTKSEILGLLQDMIRSPKTCKQVASSCKPILAEIVARIMSDEVMDKDRFLDVAKAISILLVEYPYLSEITEGFFSMLKHYRFSKDMNESQLQNLVETYKNLLTANCQKFFMLIDWHVVKNVLVNSKQNCNAVKCVTLTSDYCDISKVLPQSILEDLLSNEANSLCVAKDDTTTSNEMEIGNDVQEKCFGDIYFTASDVQSNLVPLAGVLLPVKQKVSKLNSELEDFVITPSCFATVQALAFSVMTRTPVLLEGDLGAGKTSLLDYFALMMGKTEAPEILKLQLGDQTDSKSMLGIYICAETPGEFKWQPGTLTKAVRNGSWLVLEDIDSAPLDVISILMPLLEGKPLSIPGQSRAIIPAPGFQIFMTRRLSKGYGVNYQNMPSKSIEHLCTKLHLESLSKEELLKIVCTKHPHLESIAAKLVDVYCMISSDLNLKTANDTALSSLPAIKRQSTSRDFFKWCRRLAERFEHSALVSVNHEVFQEAFSCFCIPVGNLEDRLTLAHAIGAKLSITKDKVDFYVLRNKGSVQQTQMTFSVGRSSLAKKEISSYALRNAHASNYAFTRHSLNLLEQIAICVSHNEPVLLVGETGCGKTTTIQYLATQCGHKFDAINMSQQSDVTDFLGGFKPVDFKQMVMPIREKFEDLFVRTFSQKQNVKFLGHIQQCFAEKKWEILLKLMEHCKRAALKRKGLKKELHDMEKLMSQWKSFGLELKKTLNQLREGHSLAFAFMEGRLVKAIKNGEWILLDEINLATAETLECLSGLLESRSGSVVLVERGDAEPIRRHEDFRLFACMNPATDIGKKDLPFGIRNRFTEIYVDELNDVADLKVLVSHYLQNGDVTSRLVDGIVRFYQLIQNAAKDKLTDGTGHRPHYSLRTLCRALEYVARNTNMLLPKAIYEGFCLSFLTQLDRSSHPAVEAMIKINILGHLSNVNSLLSQSIPCPGKTGMFCQIEGYWIAKGELPVAPPQEYVLTESVKENLRDLARVVSGRNYPVLLQGETSVGKTSLITFLAKSTGNQCVRINNHEHTDIQEYIGCYSADENGKLVFKDGLLVDAMRKGYWIILDELNLAPTDVLEALNRLLDDNRELFIAETQETVKAHAKFMLFATQNPPGQYGGRKILSRAFRNRFVELHFDEIPSDELQIILHKRCHLPRSYCSKFVAVMQNLQARRKSSGIFAGKHGFITLRDLFRWAERYRQTPTEDLTSRFYDWDQHIAEDGYMLLAGRCRKTDESIVVQETIERIMKRKINLEVLYKKGSLTTSNILKQLRSVKSKDFEHLVWTNNLQRMAVLVGRAIQFNEPVLLVGETGCGKTTICQLFSHLRNSELYSVNCHMHTESSDFIGGLRPVRHRDQESDEMKLFEWSDGPLVSALKDGSSFLIDEISLADDSVLERLNSVLETEKSLVLAEKGGSDDSNDEEIELIVANPKFRLMATMNPGGDFGKKELSPALRNRFTEIWCPQSEDHEDFVKIIEHNIQISDQNQESVDGAQLGEMMVAFVNWFTKTEAGQRITVSIRDYLSWANFINKTCSHCNGATQVAAMLSPQLAYIHGAFLVFIDAIGSGSTWSGPGFSLENARIACLSFLKSQVDVNEDATQYEFILNHPSLFGISPFMIERGPLPPLQSIGSYSLTTKTTSENTLRLLRALQLARPILLEGSPGVGKTSLVTALAEFSRNQLTRINLSEQTDVTDLFGADLPVEGGKGGEFAWSDGPFLKALKQGQWIVLDELNLASQSVLEGLNACFDHRGEIFVPELGKSFHVQHQTTRIFACQNPLSQGGGRKGLPKSFLNRFTKVYIEHLKEDDLLFIINASYRQLDKTIVAKMIQFNAEMQRRTMISAEWGQKGSPWEFNVRDILRWCELLNKYQDNSDCDPSQFLNLIYVDRMRTTEDKEKVYELYAEIFQDDCIWKKSASRLTQFSIGPSHFQVGHSILPRTNKNVSMPQQITASSRLLRKQIPYLESVMKCIEMNWMAILVGPKACGKTRIVETLAELTGNTLNTLAMNSNMDTTEMLGGFEQVNLGRHLDDVVVKIETLIGQILRSEIDLLNVAESKASSTIAVLMEMKRNLKFCELDGLNQVPHETEDESSKVVDIFKCIDEVFNTLNDVLDDNEYLKAQADEIKLTFEALKTRFEKEGMSIHAKGQFAWVDGILVEALKQGTWLLVDNVNFCSPSVLDRLNGLLEPNGVLSIDERGVQNNDIPTVKPHPDFRLFLTMDPKHGEISRAMRNRGIEIYIVGEDEGMPYTLDDKLELISSVGLNDEVAQCKLLAIYERITVKVPHSITDLVKASRLTKQVFDRGFSRNEALRLACSNVFASNQLDVDIKESTISVIESFTNPSSMTTSLFEQEDEEMDNSKSEVVAMHQGEHETLIESQLLLPSVMEFSQLSTLARIKRDGILLKYLQNEPQDENVVSFALKWFMERASVDDCQLRMTIVLKEIEKIGLNGDQVKAQQYLVAALKSTYESNIFHSIKEHLENISPLLPHCPRNIFEMSYDLRLNRRLLQDIFLTAKKNPELVERIELIMSLYNRMELLQDRLNISVKERVVQEQRDQKTKPSLLEVSKKFLKGSYPASKLPHPVVELFHPYFTLLGNLLDESLQHCECHLSDGLFHKLIFSLKWRDRFWRLCSKAEPQRVTHFYKALYAIHWKWIVEELNPHLTELFSTYSSERLVEHERFVAAISARFSEELPTNMMQLDYCTLRSPPPFHSPDVFAIWSILEALKQELDFSKYLQHEREVENMKNIFEASFCEKKLSLYKCLTQFECSTMNKQMSNHEIIALQTAITMAMQPLQNESITLTNSPVEEVKRMKNMQPEFLLISGQINLLSWLRILQSATRVDHSCCESTREMDLLLKRISVLKQLVFLHDVNDLGIFAMLSAQMGKLKENKISYLPGYSLPALRSHVHEVSTFQLRKKMMDSLSKAAKGQDSQTEDSLNPFSNTSATVMVPWMNERFAFKEKVTLSTAQSMDSFEWKISVKEIDETQTFLSALLNFNWIHGGTLSLLPHKILRSTVCDTILMLAELLKTLQLDSLVDQDLESAIENDKPFSCLLEILSKLKSDAVNNADLPFNIKQILVTIGLFAEKEQQMIRSNMPDDHDLFMWKVRFGGATMICIGFCRFLLNLPRNPYDIAEEAKLRCHYFQEELNEVNAELDLRYSAEEHLCGAAKPNIANHEKADVEHFTSNEKRAKLLLERRTFLIDEIEKLKDKVALRPNPSQYDMLIKDLIHFHNNVTNHTAVLGLILNSTDALHEAETGKPFPRNLQRRIKIWISSTKQFVQQMEKNFQMYPDIVSPIKWALMQIMTGFYFNLFVIDWQLSKPTPSHMGEANEVTRPAQICRTLASFPASTFESLAMPSETAAILLSQPFTRGITDLLDNQERHQNGMTARILHLALSHISVDVILRGHQSKIAKTSLGMVLIGFYEIWLEFSEEERRKEAELDATYKFKSKSHCVDYDDTTLNEKSFKDIFPSFSHDYQDLIPKNSLDDGDDNSTSNVLEKDDEIPMRGLSHDMAYVNVVQIYENLKIVLNATACCFQATNENLIQIFLNGFKEFLSLASLDAVKKDPLIDCQLIASNLLFTSLLKKSFDTKMTTSSMEFDIYHENNLVEAQKLLPLLGKFSKRLSELLDEFPEHPALLQIQQIIDRILSFPVNQPLMKFLTGLEILLRQSQDWESYASSRVSIKNELQSVTDQIVEWRKLELKSWPHLLQVVEKKFEREAKGWFLKISSALEDVKKQMHRGQDARTTQKKEFAKLLQGFIESSSIGEFSARLELINTLYKLSKDDDTGLAAVLWNIYSYYKQFIPAVNEDIEKSKTRIQKDLKDFIKVAKWKDVNFYAMKQAAEKSHRTLHKYMRRFEELLSSPVSKHLIFKDSIPGDTSQHDSGIKLDIDRLREWGRFLAPRRIMHLDRCNLSQNEWLNQAGKMTVKLAKKCSKYLRAAKHHTLIQSLDEFTGDVISNLKELQSVDILSLPEEKRANSRKNLDLRKRKALATLFKALANMGLSYRKGLNIASQRESEMNVLSPILDEDLYADQSEERSVLFRDCHVYYFKCLARQSALHQALGTPSKELSPQDVARSKGFTDHLNSIVQKQREQIEVLMTSCKSIRAKARILGEIVKFQSEGAQELKTFVPPQRSSVLRMEKLKNLVDLTIYVMKQFNLLIQSCPESNLGESVCFLPEDELAPIAKCTFQDDELTNVLKTVEAVLDNCLSSKSVVDTMFNKRKEDSSSFLFSWEDQNQLQRVGEKMEGNCVLFKEIENAFKLPRENAEEGLARSVYMLRMKTGAVLSEIRCIGTYTESSDVSFQPQDLGHPVESTFKGILTCVQELFKLDSSSADSEIRDENDEEEVQDSEDLEDLDLLEGHLIPCLEKNFYNEVHMLKSSSVSMNLSSLFQEMRNCFDSRKDEGTDLILIYPIIEQYSRMIEYFLEKLLHLHRTSCKLLYVLSGIFTDLATQGFCLPPDQVETSGEGATEFEDIQGGGIGEGEGMKDVSEQIEDESQIQGTEQEQKEEKSEEQDKNIPNEEQGIEMSDDFDGRLHDVDPDEEGKMEDSDEEKEDEEEQPDDKMGQLDGLEEEKFDERFWGDSDDEDENEVADENDKGPGADGREESELVAKDENEGEQKGDKKEKKSENEENPEEINELSSDEINEEEDEDDDVDAGNQNKESYDNKEPEKVDDDFADDLEFQNDENEDLENEPQAEESNIDAEVNDDDNMKDEEGEEENDEKNENDKAETEAERIDEPEEDKDEQDNENARDKQSYGEDAMEEDNDDNDNEEKNETEIEHDVEAEASEAQTNDSSAANTSVKEATAQNQNAIDEQQQQQDKGYGTSQQEGNEGHSGISSVLQNQDDSLNEKKNRKKDYNRSRQDRSLADDVQQKLKRLKTEDQDETKQKEEQERAEKQSSDLYQHIQGNDDYDAHTLDAATSEQTMKQSDMEREMDDEDTEMDNEEDNDEQDDKGQNKEKMEDDETQLNKKMKNLNEKRSNIDDHEDEKDMEEETPTTEEPTADDVIEDAKFSSGFFTSREALNKQFDTAALESYNNTLRKELEKDLASWVNTRSVAPKDDAEAVARWRKYEALTSSLSQQLCEQLRLVLEPTMASKLKGDYRTGKRLNMRKVISYIASQFRKDKIWLRRTKKSRRQYQILLAVDDSSSMGDNHSKQLAFESLAVISNALTWLEAGELAVCSFGESTKLLHSFKEPFNEEAGAHILCDFTFEQKKTHVAKMLDTCAAFMSKERSNVLKSSSNRIDTSQLLLIVSDGRGIFLEGKEVVERSVRQAREAGIFIVFIILDNPSNKDSILDIRIPIFKPGGGFPEIKSYIEEFPFPFYMILRDINSLPVVLSDALRQWFELVIGMT